MVYKGEIGNDYLCRQAIASVTLYILFQILSLEYEYTRTYMYKILIYTVFVYNYLRDQ